MSVRKLTNNQLRKCAKDLAKTIELLLMAMETGNDKADAMTHAEILLSAYYVSIEGVPAPEAS